MEDVFHAGSYSREGPSMGAVWPAWRTLDQSRRGCPGDRKDYRPEGTQAGTELRLW